MRTYKSIGYKKRHYEDIARILGEALRTNSSVSDVTSAFTHLFARDNERFNPSRFDARVGEYRRGDR